MVDELSPQSESSESEPVVAAQPVEVVEEPSFDSASSKAKVQVPGGTCENWPIVENELSGSKLSLAVDVLPPVMTETEARQCIQDIKDLGNSLRAKLLDLDVRQGWAALGYPSMTACIKAEFADAGSKSNVIREWNAGQIERELEVQICTYPAYQLRPLRKLQPEQRKTALLKAKELAGNRRLTAAHFTKAVDEILNSARQANQTEPPPYKPGDLVRIHCLAGALPEQKTWNGCWAIVQSTSNISYVRVLVGSKEVDYMAGDLDWDDNSDTQFRDMCERILALWQAEIEPIEQTVVKELQRRHFFTDMERRIVSLMESKHSFRASRT